MRTICNCFIRTQSGAVLIKFAVLVPVIFGSVAAAIDYGSSATRWSRLQHAADSAALAVVAELSLANPDSKSIESTARAVVLANLKQPESVTVATQVLDDNALEVRASEKITSLLGRFLNYPHTEVQVKAVARVAAAKLCLLALETKQAATVSLKKKSRLTGLQCSIFSNSADKGGIKAEDYAQVDAEVVCSVGGVDGKHGHFSRKPHTDCPAVPDPLVNRAPPAVGACDFNKTEIKAGVRSLQPGVYCGGLKITDGASVSLAPGVYIIQGGKLTVDHGSTMEGVGVGFYLAGKESSFEFGYDSSISLSAPKTGVMAGLLFFDDRAGKWDKHKIYSNDARTLLGTIYLPNGSLYIDSQKPIADKSAYTVLVTRTLELYDGPNLVLNSNYEASSVPVPQGVGPIGTRVLLTK